MNKIIKSIDISPEDDKLYLIDKHSDISGLFVSNKKLIYMVKNIEFASSCSLQTDYLKLQSNVNIISIANSQNFDSGFYNLIEYKLPANENIAAFESFINLCTAHIKLMQSKNFVEFFNSLIDLFKNETREKNHNILGLFGELSLIYYFYNEYGVNLAQFWHTAGAYSKYDFSIDENNIEVKTSNSIKNILIKHAQIFNDDQNYLAIALVENNNAGMTLKELERKLKDIKVIANDFNFILNLEAEKSRIKSSDYADKKLQFIGTYIYDCKTINPFLAVPANLSNIEYRIDLINYSQIDNKKIKNFINS